MRALGAPVSTLGALWEHSGSALGAPVSALGAPMSALGASVSGLGVSMSMYVCMSVCLYVSMFRKVWGEHGATECHPCWRASLAACLHVCMSVCLQVCNSAGLYICMYVCMSVYLYVHAIPRCLIKLDTSSLSARLPSCAAARLPKLSAD